MGKNCSVWLSDETTELVEQKVRDYPNTTVSRFLSMIIDKGLRSDQAISSETPLTDISERLCPAYSKDLERQLHGVNQAQFLAQLLADLAQHPLPRPPVHAVSWQSIYSLRSNLTNLRAMLVITGANRVLAEHPMLEQQLADLGRTVDELEGNALLLPEHPPETEQKPKRTHTR